MLMHQIQFRKNDLLCDCWDSFEIFKEGISSKEKFCNSLIYRAISDRNCEHFLKVWKAFKMNTMKYYNDFYLEVDVLLLTCVFENFPKEAINTLNQIDIIIYLLLAILQC